MELGSEARRADRGTVASQEIEVLRLDLKRSNLPCERALRAGPYLVHLTIRVIGWCELDIKL